MTSRKRSTSSRRRSGVSSRSLPYRRSSPSPRTVVEVLEQNPLRRIELRRARLGDTGLVGELIVSGNGLTDRLIVETILGPEEER